jgi:hypothetical protein
MPGRNMHIVLGPGKVELTGILRRSEGERGLFYLETDDGPPVLLFAQQNAPVQIGPYLRSVGRRMKVTWDDGRFTAMTPGEPESGTF